MIIQEDIKNWLLEDDNPPIKYLTLRNLLDHPSDSRVLIQTKEKLMDYEPTLSILDHFEEFMVEKDQHKR